MMSSRSGNIASVVLLCASTFGCGSGEYVAPIEPTVPAAGVIKFKGEPLDYYRVSLIPDGKRPAAGLTGEDGRFVLGTNEESDGAVVGSHTVTVQYIGPAVEEEPGKETFAPPRPAKVKVPAKYHSAASSGVKVEIPEGGKTDLEINLE